MSCTFCEFSVRKRTEQLSASVIEVNRNRRKQEESRQISSPAAFSVFY